MKKGKRIWNRLLSLMLCLVMVTGVFAGMGMEAEAATAPAYNTQGDYGTERDWRLTPGNTGQDFYNHVKNLWGNNTYGIYKDSTFITTEYNGNEGIMWKDILSDNITFTNGKHYVYVYNHNPNASSINRVLYRINVRVAYSVGVSVSGAPSGGGITVGSNNYGNGNTFEVGESDGITFSVQSVMSYRPIVTFDGETISSNNGTYTISNAKLASASDKKIYIEYSISNASNVTITQPENATISFNGSTASSQTVAQGYTYEIKATPADGYAVTGLYVDGIKISGDQSRTITVNDWKALNQSHEITATVAELALKAKDNQTMRFREDWTAEKVAKDVFDAIYDDSSLPPLTRDMVNLLGWSSTEHDEYLVLYHGASEENLNIYNAYTASGSGFGTRAIEYVKLEYNKNGSGSWPTIVEMRSSAVVKLNIEKIQVSPNGTLEKTYDGTPISLDQNDFIYSKYQNEIKEFEIEGHYNKEKQLLNTEPTDAGTYFVKVKVKDELGYNTSDFIEYKINKRPITITANNQTVDFGTAITSDASAVTVTEGTLVANHVFGCSVTADTTNATTNGKLTVSNVKIKNGTADYTDNYDITLKDGTLVINQISQDALTIEMLDEVIYNSREQKPLVIKLGEKTLTAGTDYTVEYSNNVKVGTATVTVTSSNWDGTITKTFKIIRKNITAFITDADEIYDGTAKAENAEIILTDLESTDSVSATCNISYADANVGTNKNVTATNVTLTGEDANNYQLVDGNNNPTTTLNEKGTITARPITVTANSASKTYGNADPELTWDVTSELKVVDGETLSDIEISRAEGENVGIYQITVGQPNGANSNYDIKFVYADAKFTINKKELTVDVAVEDKQYDGLKKAAYSTVLNGVVGKDDVTLNCEDVTAAFDSEEVGEAIDVTLTGDFSLNGAENLLVNYTLTQPAKTGYKADIYNTYDASEYMVTPDEWTNGSVTIVPQEGYCIAIENKDNSEWKDELEVSNETGKEGATITFYLRNESTKAISLPETVTYFIDKTYPTGSITIAENKFNTFLNTITFGTFFNKTQTVTFAAADDLSGVAKIEYYESAEGLTNEQIVNLPADAWTKGDSVNVTLEDAKKFVYYARITDKAGNQICISSDGNVYDITYPAITGITNGETYYTTQIAEISDTNLDEVKLNGESLTITDGKIDPITLEGNKDTTYAIVATDKAGNVTTVTVTMKTIASLSDQLADVTEENVTSEDAELIDEIQKIIADENLSNATEDEKELLKELSEKCDDLEELLEETKEAVSKSTEIVDKVTEGGVTLNEESKLEEAKEKLEKTLENNKNNLTEEEKKAIQKTIDDLDAIIDVIEKVKEAVKAVEAAKSADGEYGVPDNEKAVKAYEKAKAAYDSLTEEQKAMLGADVKKALKEAKTAITNYKIIEGDGKIWVYDTNGTLTFVGNGLVRKLKNVIVDGEVFPMENCHISKGSTVVEVEASALYWLGLGSHTFQLEYTDGKSDVVEFSIVTMEEWNAMMNQTGTNQNGTGAATGDSANILLWGAALAVGAAGMVVAKKRRKDEEA